MLASVYDETHVVNNYEYLNQSMAHGNDYLSLFFNFKLILMKHPV